MPLTIGFVASAGHTGASIDYAANSVLTGKYARYFNAGAPVADMLRYRVPGTDGTLIVRAGNIGHKINMTVRYINDTIELAEAALQTDLTNMANGAYDITSSGLTYTACNLVPGSAKKTSPVLPTGRVSGQVFFDVALQFTEDQPA